jgi:thiamine-phosphate pyrophosphorylase
MPLIVANGRRYEVEDGASVRSFVVARALDPATVYVERNGEPLPRDTYASTNLCEGDVLELVRAVAGGAGERLQGEGVWRRARLAYARLYLCVDRRDGGAELEAFLEATLAAGVDLVQLRDKQAAPAELRAASDIFRRTATRHSALFILNDDPALAVEVGADGVHVGQDDASPDEARAIVGQDRLIGRSTHSEVQFDQALGQDCDYLAIGPVHATPTKAGRPAIGLDPIRQAAAVAGDRPWFVTGAMGPDTAPDVLDAGATRLVVVRAITQSPDPAAAARRLTEQLRAGSEAAW